MSQPGGLDLPIVVPDEVRADSAGPFATL